MGRFFKLNTFDDVMKNLVCISLLTAFFLLLAAAPAAAQPADSLIAQGKRLLQQGADQGEAALMQQARAAFERASADAGAAPLAHYYAGLTGYRLLYAPERPAEKIDLIDDAIAHLDQATAQDADFADAHALRSSMLGQKIAEQWYKGPFLGPKADDAMERAKTLAPENPRVVLLEAIGAFNKPGMFGGDKEKALGGFRKAAQLFEQETAADPLAPQWGHDEAYAWIGIAHVDAGRPAEARQAFEQALAINPDYGWVKNVLMPKVAEVR